MKIATIDNKHNLYKKTNINNINFCQREVLKDKIEITASNDGMFSKREAGKNFLKGIFSPLKTIIEHPIISIGTVAVTGIACSLIPVLTPVMSIGFGTLSVIQLGKGIFDSIGEYKKGNYDNSEKAFEKIGKGTIGTLGSITSIKRSARIAEEAYAMNMLEKPKLTFRERSKIKDNSDKRSLSDSLDIIFSLFKTTNGKKAFINQFKPFMIKERAKDLISSLNPANKKTDIIKSFDKKMYRKTAEGKRRMTMSEADIKKEVTTKFDKVFDELGIEKEYRPELIIENIDSPLGGYYDPSKHRLLYNTNSYRNGLGDIDEVLMHEGTHCKRALLRSGLSKTEIENTTKSILRSRILNGDVEEVPFATNGFSTKTVEPPLMSKSMRFDFLKLAEKDLFNDNTWLNRRLIDYEHQHFLAMTKSGYANPLKLSSAKSDVLPILDKLKEILNKHPEFVGQYDSYDEALDVLLKYSISQNSRYISSVSQNVNVGKIKYPISESQINLAKQSVSEYITTIDGNKIVSNCYGKFVDRKAYNQYQFSDEEVLAQQVATKFVVQNVEDELAIGKQSGTLSPERELYLSNQLKKAQLSFEHRTKGLEYYKNYTRLRNNPNNSALKTLVEQQGKEVETLMQQINKLRPQYKEKVVYYFDKMTAINPFNLIAMTLSKIRHKEEE